MKKFFLNNYKFITVTLAILAIGVSISLYFLNKETRIFTYEIISANNLINITKLIPRDDSSLLYKKGNPIDKLLFYYEEKPIKAPFYTLIRVKNVGNSPIKSTDFESPIEIQFAENIKIYECSILDTEPRNLKTTSTFINGKASIAPTLFNPGDYITIGILTSETNSEPQISARIIGIKSIEKRISNKRNYLSSGIVNIIFSVLLLYAAFALYSLTIDKPKLPSLNEFKIIYVILLTASGVSFADGVNYFLSLDTAFRIYWAFLVFALLAMVIFVANMNFRMKVLRINADKE
ncbi:MAG: hypothetical protein A2W27_02990 [Deltaproteobacteria bacterium RBG_16_44_11]|nr:MAG: hypothetical protein A2W27_02990 [Deltaproteobacteria bacterium RBG_16_44_11]